jgi:hypothetical protein
MLTMESADSNQSMMAGVVEDLKFTVGDIDFLLQVHIVDRAPFDILMGRPFPFTECHTKDRSDGTQELTITCLNNRKVLSIATRKKPPKLGTFADTNYLAVDISNVDFI